MVDGIQEGADGVIGGRTSRLIAKFAPSSYIKDLTVGGVAFVAIRIVFIYLKTLSVKPELIAGMGPKLILDILGVCIVGVILNRALDVFSSATDRIITCFDSSLGRMADSADRTALATQQGAIAQGETAAAQRDIAASQREATQVLQKVDSVTSRQLEVVQSVQSFQVSQIKAIRADQGRTSFLVEQLAEKSGIKVPEGGSRNDD